MTPTPLTRTLTLYLFLLSLCTLHLPSFVSAAANPVPNADGAVFQARSPHIFGEAKGDFDHDGDRHQQGTTTTCQPTHTFGGPQLSCPKIVQVVKKAGFVKIDKCVIATILAECGAKGHTRSIWLDNTCHYHKGLFSLPYPFKTLTRTCALNPPCAAHYLYKTTHHGTDWEKFKFVFEACGAGLSALESFCTPKKHHTWVLEELKKGTRKWEAIVEKAWWACETPTPTTNTCGNGNVGDGICANSDECCSEWGWCGKRFCSIPSPEPS
ncbi:hypothetical protein HDV00_007173 [Rhizophlyctis rosea]|nr:hypothetical protein HDV00_007173 [Rhizophlyctis rosea]